jgi:hypothetical protein
LETGCWCFEGCGVVEVQRCVIDDLAMVPVGARACVMVCVCVCGGAGGCGCVCGWGSMGVCVCV